MDDSAYLGVDPNNQYPRVSTILNYVNDWSWMSKYKREYYQTRGTHVHTCCDMIDGGYPGQELDKGATAPELLGYCESYERWLKDNNVGIRYRELTIIDKGRGYKGTLDRIGTAGGFETLWDIKSGGVEKYHGMQVWAYAMAYRQQTGDKTLFVKATLHLDKGGGKARQEPWHEPQHWRDFVTLLEYHRLRGRLGLKEGRR